MPWTDRTTPAKRFLFYLATAGIRLVTLPLARSLRGVERLPQGPYVVAANHRSLLDGLVLVNELNRVRGRPIHMVAYQEPFGHSLYGPLLKITGCLPFDRGEADSRVRVLRLALGFLEAGEPVAFFPEAHLSRTSRMRRGRPGAALVALESGAPVVPVGLRGTERVLEPGTGRFRLRRAACVHVGEPLDLSPWRAPFLHGDAHVRAQAVERATAAIMHAIAALSGQTYDHVHPQPRRQPRR